MGNEYQYLGRVNSPEDLKKLDKDEIAALCGEVRQCIVSTTERNGGHLASNLGVVELTVALHKVFDCPRDHFIFDVGHQSYTHKLLTERFDRFDTLRRAGGLTGFTNRDESKYDCFGAGHSSTSLSAALGFAKADKLSGSDAYTIAVLGDGAFTGGMIHEALNNCDRDLKLIIILNENEMSISKNIGRFAGSLAKLRRKSGYFKAKRATGSFIKKIPLIGKWLFRALRDMKKSLKNTLYGSNYFEDMGLYYLGPADGNCYEDVEALLNAAKSAGESVLVHLKTKKGKGYAPAEENPDRYHGLAPMHMPCADTSFSREMGECLSTMADEDETICAITAAMSGGTGLDGFANKYPERFFDVGIAEEHAVTFAAGLAANGMKPVFAVYSSFLQRSYDQMIHDVALQRLPVVLCVDRAGFNNSDGATHHGIFDVAFTSQIPSFRIYAPVTYRGLALSLKTALNGDMPAVIRYPAGSECREIVCAFYGDRADEKIGIRCDFVPKDQPKILMITHGRIAKECLAAEKLLFASGLSAGTVLCEYIAPYDRLSREIGEVIAESRPEIVLFVEEEIKNGGFGMLLAEELQKHGLLKGVRFDILATENPFAVRKPDESYLKAAGLDAGSIADRAKNLMEL
ncbi:MAG: 1-deoxy-D-xylulose-5-phosphate synthase [Clostridia bacterium]|nr:1-deoxy-D-xylulose-5-phosphate synthase [Clostridia bacterium]